MATPTDELKELKQIAQIRFDKERHRLASINDEINRLDSQKQALHKQIKDLTQAPETSSSSLMNAYAYLDALSRKAEQLELDRLEVSERTKAQREKIKDALASKIRVDGMGED